MRKASGARKCFRELPLIWQSPQGPLVEGTIDLAFEEQDQLIVLDFKTDREMDREEERYRRQLGIYCRALSELRGMKTRGILMRI